jgi:hypothetical protein
MDKDTLGTFVTEIFRPVATFRLEVYKIIGGEDALTKYNDEDILRKIKDLKFDEEHIEKDMTQWALDHIS